MWKTFTVNIVAEVLTFSYNDKVVLKLNSLFA